METFTHITDEEKRYNIEWATNGDEIRHYESGVIYNMTQGVPMGRSDLERSDAQALQIRQVETRREEKLGAMRLGIKTAISKLKDVDIGDISEDMTISALFEYQTALALKISEGRASTNATKFIMEEAELLPSKQIVSIKDGIGGEATGTKEDIKEVLQYLREKRGEIEDNPLESENGL